MMDPHTICALIGNRCGDVFSPEDLDWIENRLVHDEDIAGLMLEALDSLVARFDALEARLEGRAPDSDPDAAAPTLNS